MAKKGKGRVNQKQVNTQSRKNILVDTSSQPTEPIKDEEKVIEQYVKATRSHVPVESSAGELITNFLVKWSHWIAWIGLFAAAIFAYSAFSNDITNAKDELVKNIPSGENRHIFIDAHKKDKQVIIQIKDNANELINTIVKLKPSSLKGTYVKSISMSSTMSPGIAIETKVE